jgi:hypothetical protein
VLTGIAAYAGYRTPPAPNVPLALAMLNNTWAVQYRQANPRGYLILRPDQGDDAAQIDYNAASPEREALRFDDRYIRPNLKAVPPGTYSASLGPCEDWPAGDRLDFRARFEESLCRMVQEGRGLDYIALSCPVGNLDAADVGLFASTFRAARWVSYHAYMAPGVSHLDAEPGPWYFWRPTRVWLPELRRLGLPLRLLCTEVGTYTRMANMGSRILAQHDVLLARALAAECATLGVEFGGALPFGFGLVGDMAQWNLDGSEDLFAGGEAVPDSYSVGPGVRAAMAERSDSPRSSETYIGSEWSFTLGGQGAYVYSRAANWVTFVPPVQGQAGQALGPSLALLADQLTQLAAALRAAVEGRT